MFKKIYIEITNHCNLNCSFCKTNVRDKLFLSPEDFEIIINKIKNHTDFVYLHVLGEPLLHKDLFELIKICKNNNINVNITTNGTLLDKTKSIFLDDDITNIHQMNISIHSQYQSIMDENIYLTNLLSFITDINKKFYINLRLWNEDNNIISTNNLILIQKLHKFFYNKNKIKKEYKRNQSITLSEKVFLHIDKKFIWPNINNEENFFKGNCYALLDHIAILSNGSVVPCCLDGDGQMALGNIFNQSLDDILLSSKAIKILNGFKNQHVLEKYCRTCGFAVRNNS